MKRSIRVAGLTIIAALAIGVTSVLAVGAFFQGFETDTSGWFNFGGGTIARVASGTDGITSADGAFHGEITGEGPFTRWGGYENTFPTGGYFTQVDIYLDMAENSALLTDKRLDFSSAINTPAGVHQRDFIFSAGTDPTTIGQWAVSASNNSPGWPSNPLRSPIFINETGWYTFRHAFQDDGTGVLEVVMEVLDSDGTVLGTWTLSDPSDVIGGTVGGSRYGWLVTSDFDTLAIDNSEKGSLLPRPANKNACKDGGWESLYRADGTPFKNQGDCIQYVNTGK